MSHSPDINIHSGIAQLMNTSTATTTQQILFIDSQVQDLDELLAGVQPNTAVYVLHPQENGIAQITTILQQYSAIETVYLVAHGKPGCLYLGNTIFNQETLPTVSELLKNWNIGQLLIYACNVANGETGEVFLHSLHHYTKAKIAASSHSIGQTEFGQNWQLNQTTHPIEIKSVFNPEVMASYSGVLAAGDLDTTFDGDGKVLTVGNTDQFESVTRMLLQSDGKIIVARNSLVLRYNSNGSLDTSFDGDGQKSIINDVYMDDVALQADGKILFGGAVSSVDSSGFTIYSFGFVRYNSNGSLDTSFDGDGKVITNLSTDFSTGYDIRDMVLQADGKILVAGKYNNDFVVARFNSNGTPDTTFSDDGKLTTDFDLGYDEANSIAVQPDGKIVVAGSTDNPGNSNTFAAARYNSNGTLDSTFSGDGKFATSGFYGKEIALQSDSKILLGGSDTGYSLAVARLNSNGSLDTSFDGDGIATPDIYLGNYIFSNNQNMVLQPNGKIILVGQSNNDFGIVRFNNNGSLDTTFSGDGKLTTDLASSYDYAESVAVQTDGKIVVAGIAKNSVANYVAIARYKGDGISGTANNDIFIGTANPDDYNGLGGNDLILGFAGNDGLNGGDGNDSLDGGTGADQLQGEAGDDVYTVDNTGDIVTELASQGRDLVQSSITYTLPVNVEDLTLTGSSAINGTGNTLNNTITGNNANNTLNGSTGADLLVGRAGNDTYIVENANDVVAEALSEGTDLVQSSITYTLPVNVENLTLTGTTAINGTGNALVNIITGNTANNILNGSTGADQLKGSTGNDTYVVDNALDVVTELASGGTDLVQSSVTYTLPVEVENLTLTGTTAINGTGNALANIITGNTANNILNGSTGNDNLIGSSGADQLLGGDGNDSLSGDAANDTLTGGLGADKFIYNTNAAFTTTAVGLDSITDFTIAQGDLIVLDKTTFTSISSIAGTGFSVATEFAKVTTDALAATSAADIVYNTATGGLFYNQNGTAAGFGTGAQFLTLTTKPVLTATQFVIQA